jgi:blue copper oxidase
MRLRLLNGSNARSYQIHLSNNQAFVQIASDGGFLTEPVEMTNLILGPGERAEIIIDFSKFEKGDTVSLMDQETKFMRFSIGSKSNKTVNLPSKFTDIQRIDPSSAIKTRKFSFQGMGPNVNINGKQMDMDRIDEVLTLHTTEIWEVTNNTGGMMGGMPHPFHAHGTQFQILDRDENPPPANETGWKDTFLVYPGEKVRAIATFNHTGTFMYHCHILEHEDAGMMGQFQVK